MSYKVDYVPQHLQLVIKDSEFNEILYLPQNFSGKEKFYICFKRKNKSWIGKDSLIIKATDESGAESKGKFYFESLEERELQAIQDLNPADISYKITPSGTWFYFKNSKGIENIQYTVSQDVLNDTGCEVAGSYIFTRMVDMADSIFIPEIKNVPLKDISYSISILPVNRIGTGQGADLGFNIFNLTKSKIPLSNFEFQLLENPDQLSIIPKSAFLNCDNIYRLYLSVNGIIDSTRELLLNNHYYIPIKKGISYDLIFKDIMNRYTSDPYHLFLSRTEKETPKVTGSLKWNVSCKKQIKKATWVKNFYPPLTYQFSPSAHFDIKDEGEFIEITPKDNQWEGTAAILFKITDAGGFVIDTFALATRVKTNVPVKFKTDTLGLNIKNEWTDINLLSELEDVETPDSLMKVKILKQGNIRLKDSHYKTKIMLGKALSGVDTLTIEATDEGCANAKLTYIIKFDSTGITNQAPVFISKMKEWWFFDSINKLNPSRGYYYVDELLASPLIFDLRHFVADDQPFEDLTFTIKEIDKFGNDRISDITFDQGLDIQIKNGILTIKPKENTFYGYGKVQNERMLTTSFWIKILAEDPFGEKLNTVAAYIHISERPINFKSGVKNVIYICPGDTQTVNVRDFVESNIINGRSVPPFSIFDPGDLLPTKEYKVKGESIEFIEKRNIFLPEQEQLLMFLKFSLPFYNTFNDPQESWLKFDNFYIISQPTCNTNPIIQKIPVQKLVNGQSANLNLWSKVQDEQQAKDLFWTFGAGSKLNYSYDYDSGELEVTAKHFDWKGVDSLFVEVEDMAGLKASTTIYYTNQSSPVIYPAINNITIKKRRGGSVNKFIQQSNR
ncbi:MAG: hypothetical protein NVV82_22320 [Sporocytophaga sp.]|nr:hypothetical protein [Sporocytophaga sp.]